LDECLDIHTLNELDCFTRRENLQTYKEKYNKYVVEQIKNDWMEISRKNIINSNIIRLVERFREIEKIKTFFTQIFVSFPIQEIDYQVKDMTKYHGALNERMEKLFATEKYDEIYRLLTDVK